MFSFTEFHGESNDDRRQRGSLGIQGEYIARRKAAWLVLGKLAIVLFVVGFGYILALRHIDFPPLQLTAAYFGVVLIYCGVSYVIRPNPDYGNMGWFGGMMNDPTQYSDNINRGLRDLECLLQPGQLATESVFDLLILFGVHRAHNPAESADDAACESRCLSELPPAPSATTGRLLSPDRFDV